MIDLSLIKKYIVDDNKTYDSNSEHMISIFGFDKWFDRNLDMFLNCSKLSNEGHRQIQTNHIHYKYEITTLINMIEKYIDDNIKDSYYQRIIDQHISNLEFEKINGLEYTSMNNTKKSKSNKRKNKQTSLDFDNKPKKETAAERKLKAHAAKITALKFKIKPVNNDNTL